MQTPRISNKHIFSGTTSKLATIEMHFVKTLFGTSTPLKPSQNTRDTIFRDFKSLIVHRHIFLPVVCFKHSANTCDGILNDNVAMICNYLTPPN